MSEKWREEGGRELQELQELQETEVRSIPRASARRCPLNSKTSTPRQPSWRPSDWRTLSEGLGEKRSPPSLNAGAESGIR